MRLTVVSRQSGSCERSESMPDVGSASCSGNPNPHVHPWNYYYPIVVCGSCGIGHNYLYDNWCEEAEAPHKPGMFHACKCEVCGEDTHLWDGEYVDSEYPHEPASIRTACRRCGYKNPNYEKDRKYWEDRAKERPSRIHGY